MSDTEEVTEHLLPTPSRAGLTDHKGAIGGIYNGLGARRDDIIPPERQKLKGASHIKHTTLTSLCIKLNEREIKTGTPWAQSKGGVYFSGLKYKTDPPIRF
ncbi:hypothetical protein QQF64_020664 [Cirrhinus molitorella]|uniref:Uncharacterized protein n=1 Tax=Cirrhinus molitorella TaxID=172907 RepID=A0ABR3LD76_9TELE